jgi:hypothetical protein
MATKRRSSTPSSFAGAFREAAKPRRAIGSRHRSDGATALPFCEWATRIPEPKTGALDFAQFPFQRELYAEGVDLEQVHLMKSTQVGASAWLVRWSIYWVDRGDTMLYVFPAEEQLRSFYNARIATLLRGPHLDRRVENATVSNVHQREIGGGWLYLRGAQSVAGLETIDADGIAMDEYDLIPKEAIPVAERRISAPTSRGLVRRIGWPSIDGYGIARKFDESDRRRWFVKCPKCREQQFLRFFKRRSGGRDEEESGDGLPNATSAYVDVAEAKIRCGKCEKPLVPEVIAKGQWVAEFPSREERGYHVHRLLVPGARLKPLIDASRLTDPWERQSFYNRDLGEPYSPKEGRLSLAAIAAAQSAGGNYVMHPWDAGYHGDGLVTMGVDSASERDLNVRISLYEGDDLKQNRALFIGQVGDWNQLRQMMDLFNVRMACIDHLPDGRLANAFAQMFYGRVFVTHFLPDTAENVLTWDGESRKAAIKRTQAVDATLGLVRSTRNRLPAELPEGYVDQMRNVVRFHELNELGKRRVGYRSLGPIDYLMSEVYDFAARELVEVEVEVNQLLDEEQYVQLEDHVEFERSVLHDDDPYAGWTPGPDSDSVGPRWEDGDSE